MQPEACVSAGLQISAEEGKGGPAGPGCGGRAVM